MRLSFVVELALDLDLSTNHHRPTAFTLYSVVQCRSFMLSFQDIADVNLKTLLGIRHFVSYEILPREDIFSSLQ